MTGRCILLWLCRPAISAPFLNPHCIPVEQRLATPYIYVDIAMCLPKAKRSLAHRRPMIETHYVAVFDPESCDLCRLPASKIDSKPSGSLNEYRGLLTHSKRTSTKRYVSLGGKASSISMPSKTLRSKQTKATLPTMPSSLEAPTTPKAKATWQDYTTVD